MKIGNGYTFKNILIDQLGLMLITELIIDGYFFYRKRDVDWILFVANPDWRVAGY
jgi:hypothetical protein